jgi:gamma-glutamyltranspeptidase/glutathione hydrolase
MNIACNPVRHAFSHFATLAALLCLAAFPGGSVALHAATNEHGVVATVNSIATDAGIAAMKAGGNAVDAAVAAGLTLGVVDGYNSGVGGGCFMLIRLKDGGFVALDGREKAPAAATRDMYLRDGKADLTASQTGPLASGIPGSLAVYDHALKKYGKLPLKHHLEAAAKVAENGFAITDGYRRRLGEAVKDLARFPASREIFLNREGKALEIGDMLKQPDLAKSYRAMAQDGIAWFYRGAFAKLTAAWMRENGGLITEADFANYEFKSREPLVTKYRDYTIVGFPPPSSGGVHVAQILQILEHFNLVRMGMNSPNAIHVIAEAMKLAFADRAYWLGDPDFAPVPRGLVSPVYAASLARQIQLLRATDVSGPGTPDRAAEDVFGKHTTHFSTADADGNWVACTATVNTTFGSKVVIPGTGIVLNNQMDDFSIQPGVPNHFGLIGAEANAVEAGKRPLSSMSPTIVLQRGEPILAVGAAGGPTIISQTLLAIIAVADFGLDPKAALAVPRFHHQWRPDSLKIEKGVGEDVLKELERRGHKLSVSERFGATQAVGKSKDGFDGAHDPRLKGKASTW